MRWSLPFLLFLLPQGGLAGKLRKRARQCKQPSTKFTNPAHTSTNPTHTSTNLTHTSTKPTQTPSTIATHTPYNLQISYQGESFLNDWVYFSQSDPTDGNVLYQTREDAINKKLAVVTNNVAILSVDDVSTVPVGGMRPSVRISTLQTFNGGLFIADFEAMPFGCSLWPAYWSTGPNWPYDGEIDVIEGVNKQLSNQMTLHTGPGCSIRPSASSLASGSRLLSTSCPSTPDSNAGCAFLDRSPLSFGASFNKANGGVFAHLWNESGISIWHWPRASIPNDITAKKPNPSQWGRPVADFPSTDCNIASHFVDHSLIIDTSICGQWAGPTFSDFGCDGTCAEFVANPKNFENAKWKINYIAVYQR